MPGPMVIRMLQLYSSLHKKSEHLYTISLVNSRYRGGFKSLSSGLEHVDEKSEFFLCHNLAC